MPRKCCRPSDKTHIPPPTKIPWDQSKIAKACWDKKWQEKDELTKEISELSAKRDGLLLMVNGLRHEKDCLHCEKDALGLRMKELHHHNEEIVEQKRLLVEYCIQLASSLLTAEEQNRVISESL